MYLLFRIKRNQGMQKRVFVLYTGGTIGMIQLEEDGVLTPFSRSEVFNKVPEINQLNIDLELKSLPAKDSSNMGALDWQNITKAIEKVYADFDGFVILHGTDTMAYTASALSFMLKGLGKPVILTGAQLPIGVIRSDAKENLIASLTLAAHPETPNEVAICFNARLYRGNRTTKIDAHDFKGFDSPNFPPLMELGVTIKRKKAHFGQISTHFSPNFQINLNVGIFKVYPGLQKNVLENVLLGCGLEGVVLELFGTGNFIESPDLQALLKKAVSQGVVLVGVTQCANGGVDFGKYSGGKFLQDIGVLDGKDMTSEAAFTKLSCLLATKSKIEIKSLFSQSIAGELSE